jgi:hypothetical protein
MTLPDTKFEAELRADFLRIFHRHMTVGERISFLLSDDGHDFVAPIVVLKVKI